MRASATHAAEWLRFWNASSVDLGPNRTALLEAYYYGSQYMLNSFSNGSSGVIPGLLGPWTTADPVGWSDGITLDYNAEANFYGAPSSNHAESMRSYFPTVSAAIPLGRARASLPDWSLGGHEAGGFHGMQTEAMGCGCAGPLGYPNCWIDIHNRTCPEGFGGFDGIEFPLQLGVFAELHSSPDGAMRSVAAMAAQPCVTPHPLATSCFTSQP